MPPPIFMPENFLKIFSILTIQRYIFMYNDIHTKEKGNQMTIKITTDHQYIDRPDCCIYVTDEGYVFRDIFGSKVYKTIGGMNRMFAKICKMSGIPTITVEA